MYVCLGQRLIFSVFKLDIVHKLFVNFILLHMCICGEQYLNHGHKQHVYKEPQTLHIIISMLTFVLVWEIGSS